MCDPLTVAGVVLTGASVAANSMAQSRVDSARADAMSAERHRQQRLQQEATAATTADQANYNDIAGKQDASAKSLGDYFQQQTAAQMPAGTVETADLPPSSSNIVNTETAKQTAKAQAYSDQQGAALGRLRSFGDVMGDLNRGTARTAGQIGQIGGFERGSSAVLPYEMESANHAGDTFKTFGDILGGLGSLGVVAGRSGKTFGDLLGLGKPAASIETAGGAPTGIPGVLSIPSNAALRFPTPYGG